MTFKFQVGQEVTVISADRNLSGMAVRIITREPGDGTTPNWYRVSGFNVRVHLAFYEDQLQ